MTKLSSGNVVDLSKVSFINQDWLVLDGFLLGKASFADQKDFDEIKDLKTKLVEAGR